MLVASSASMLVACGSAHVHSATTPPKPIRERMQPTAARALLIDATHRVSARAGSAILIIQGSMLTHAIVREVRQDSAREPAMSVDTRLDMQVVRQRGRDNSTATGSIGVSPLLQSKVRASTRSNHLEFSVAGRTMYSGTAVGISLDVGRELLQHDWLWTTTGGTCIKNNERPRQCVINIAVTGSALRKHLRAEPAGQLAQLLASIRIIRGTVTITGTTLIADQLEIFDSSGRRLRITSRYA